MRLLIGYDGSESAEAALSDLRRAGLPRDVEALILSVADVMRMPAFSSYELVEQALVSRRITSGIVLAETQTSQALKEANQFASKAIAAPHSVQRRICDRAFSTVFASGGTGSAHTQQRRSPSSSGVWHRLQIRGAAAVTLTSGSRGR